MKKQEYFYCDKDLNREATTDDFQNKKRKYFWDGNNGDKWEVIQRFGYPIIFVQIKCLDQNKEALYQVENISGSDDYFPLNKD